ncbi:hypothetical protein C8R46DRAFT_1135210 [Mycena filopes]|nr:hypothetical protein C8R46DRAFT_1135210 [Mycena filopes]
MRFGGGRTIQRHSRARAPTHERHSTSPLPALARCRAGHGGKPRQTQLVETWRRRRVRALLLVRTLALRGNGAPDMGMWADILMGSSISICCVCAIPSDIVEADSEGTGRRTGGAGIRTTHGIIASTSDGLRAGVPPLQPQPQCGPRDSRTST